MKLRKVKPLVKRIHEAPETQVSHRVKWAINMEPFYLKLTISLSEEPQNMKASMWPAKCGASCRQEGVRKLKLSGQPWWCVQATGMCWKEPTWKKAFTLAMNRDIGDKSVPLWGSTNDEVMESWNPLSKIKKSEVNRRSPPRTWLCYQEHQRTTPQCGLLSWYEFCPSTGSLNMVYTEECWRPLYITSTLVSNRLLLEIEF